MPINQIVIDGRIVSDIELRKTAKQNISVINMRLAHNNSKQKVPVYVDVEVWGKVAENLANNAKRGSSVVVHGELRRDKWETEGEPRSKLKITATKVIVENSQPTKTSEHTSF